MISLNEGLFTLGRMRQRLTPVKGAFARVRPRQSLVEDIVAPLVQNEAPRVHLICLDDAQGRCVSEVAPIV